MIQAPVQSDDFSLQLFSRGIFQVDAHTVLSIACQVRHHPYRTLIGSLQCLMIIIVRLWTSFCDDTDNIMQLGLQ